MLYNVQSKITVEIDTEFAYCFVLNHISDRMLEYVLRCMLGYMIGYIL